MKLVLIMLVAIGLLECLIWLPPLWRIRRPAAGVILVAQAVATGYLVGEYLSVWSGLIAYLSLYRGVNLLRIMQNRIAENYLRHAVRRTSLVLIAGQVVLGGLAFMESRHHPQLQSWWLGLTAVQLAGAVILAASTRRHLRTTRPPLVTEKYADRDLPTLTVAIPARNETADLEACLQSLVACNYPKLEILVLDDCSQERHTPEIIRGFAHDGVQFLAGEVPPPRWLAKNYAYQQLTQAANGEILLFCGVDVRFEADTLRRLVATLLHKKKRMLSVIPGNQLPAGRHLGALLIQPCRYAWELALPRRLFNRPPVLSTCWLIKRQLLDEAGGFEAVGHSISPESYFARQAARHQDGYSFIQSTDGIGLQCIKSLAEQQATAVRTRYPQLHRRPEGVALLTLAELIVLALPFAMLVAALFAGRWEAGALSAVSCALLLVVYGRLVSFAYRRPILSGYTVALLAALYDMILLNDSMWRYEFGRVDWKGRNVCMPVMRSVKRLPPVG